MAGLFSGLGLSSKKKKEPESTLKPKLEPELEPKPGSKSTTKDSNGTAPPQKVAMKDAKAASKEINKEDKSQAKKDKAESAETSSKNSAAPKYKKNGSSPQDTNTQQPATNQTSTSKQATSDRSPSMRLSKNAPKKVDNDFDIPSDPIAPSPTYTSSSTSIGTKVEPKITPCATIGPKISFKGELSGEEDLLVQGHVEGSISLKNNHLIIGQLGTVKANIEAKTITVEGTVQGDIVGQEKVIITATSNVDGNLKAERVILEDGAKFRGSIDMGSSSNKPKTTEANASHTAKPTTTKTPVSEEKTTEKHGTV